MDCIVSDSATIYKSDVLSAAALKKCALIFLPLRFGLDSLNRSYIESIKRCFELKQCVGIVGGKPQRSLYFIGYQRDRLLYLDPHTVFPTPNPLRPLSRQKCVFHCQEINSLDAQLLDPSMAIGFLIKPSPSDLEAFWREAAGLMAEDQFSVFSLAEQRPNYENMDELEDHGNDSSSNVDREWEKI